MDRQLDDSSWKYWVLRAGLVISFGILLVSIIKLSVIKVGYYKELARENKVVETVLPASRAQILDRKGRIMARSEYQYFKLDGKNKIFESVGDFNGEKVEGEDLNYEIKRFYPYKQSTAFVTGYVGKVNDEDKTGNKCEAELSDQELIGRSGVENFLDCQLRGVDGKRLIEVDATGKYIRELGRVEPLVKPDLTLSIDAYWQDKIYKLLNGRKAVVIMSEPKTGKIISLVSSPAFNPNDFSYDANQENIKSYLSDSENLPLAIIFVIWFTCNGVTTKSP